MTPQKWEIISIILGGIATLAIFSFLFKENPFYRFFEHIFIGIGIGLGIVETTKLFLWPKAIKPVWFAITQQADNFWGDPYSRGYLVYIIFMAFGCLYYFIYSKKHGWLARLVIGFSLGAGGGLAIKGFCSQFAPQIIASFKPLLLGKEGAPINWTASLGNILTSQIDWMMSISAMIFVLTLLCVMTYFFFSFEHDKPVIKQASISGRWLMMICFGAFFGATVMARMALLVERLDFLWAKWWPALKNIPSLFT